MMLAIKESTIGNDEIRMKISDLKLEWKGKSILVVGCGASGLSCANFLSKHDIDFSIIDSRTDVENYSGFENIANIKQQYKIVFGEFQENYFKAADILIVSPGVSIKHPYIQAAIEQGKEVIGDVDLFCQLTDVPIIAITGSNGKSTVTTLVGEILKAANMNIKVGGNIGVPCLELLEENGAECYVLELSSFQLETTSHLKAFASVILNLSEDHMDRYNSFMDYCDAKQKIFNNSENIIVNLDDELVRKLSEAYENSSNKITFGLDDSSKPDFHLAIKDGNEWVFHNGIPVVDISNIKVVGQHNKINILAALSLCSVFDIDLGKTGRAINAFSGLEHRSQLVDSTDGVQWINDSKATNIGATSAALKGFANSPVYLILGGQSKGQNFSELFPALTSNVKQIIIYGEDAALISSALKNETDIKLICTQTLEQSVELVNETVSKKDVVLFSPACASFDQFDNYMQRGDSFISYAQKVGR